jgi:hypothetical protein
MPGLAFSFSALVIKDEMITVLTPRLKEFDKMSTTIQIAVHF